MASANEIEIKLNIPPAALPALRKAVATASARHSHLQALYVDTDDGRLAAARMALRLRLEDGQWVQTLKAAGATDLARLEHNVLVDAPAGPDAPAIDPTRHAGTEVGDQLLALLASGGGQAELRVRYRTDVRRCLRVVKRAGAAIELALDEGEIVAGAHRWPVCELELELLRGSPDALVAEAHRWVDRHGLWLDVRSKAERGERLARDAQQVAAVKARPLDLKGVETPDAARRHIVANVLRQILPNAAEITSASHGAEHVHQLRVGLRRLRSGLRLCRGWGSDPLPAQWDEALDRLFGQLGAARDRDALNEWLTPELTRVGAPLVALAARDDAPDPATLLRTAEVTMLWLALQRHALGTSLDEPMADGDGDGDGDGDADGHAASPDLRRLCRQRLTRWHAGILADGERYAELDEATRHRLRRHVKRLRYALEFTATLWPAGRVRRFLAQLAPLQDALGRYSDLCMAQALYREAVSQDPRAWFAVGWLRREHDVALAVGVQALARFAEAKAPWR